MLETSTRLLSREPVHSVLGRWTPLLPIVCVATSGCRHGGAHGHEGPGQDPGPLARCEARRQQPIVDLARARGAKRTDPNGRMACSPD